jgi:predicted dehydrogenase
MQLIILDPGHFHASLLQKEMHPSLAPRVNVYAPLGPDVLDYLSRVSLFNSRKENPTQWGLDVHLSADPMAEMLRDRRGNIVILAGRNRAKIDGILASLDAGLNVLADKPWIISSSDLPKLEKALRIAAEKRVAAYDIMTERYEVTSELQRVFVNDPDVFGTLEAGSASDPGIFAHSIHHIMKTVAGVPLRRPPWFFDIAEYGEGLADVGTHLVDLVQWTAFPDEPIDYRRDIQVLEGRRWPLVLTGEQLAQVTGQARRDGGLDYFCNNSVYYTIRGVHVKLEIRWNWEAPEGSGDVYEALFRGTKARAEIRQGKAESYIPELYMVPAASSRADVFAAVRKRIAAIEERWPGLGLMESDNDIRVVIPAALRVGHEAHFGQVRNHFFDYVKSPESMPAWETANMLAKYYVSTTGVDLSKLSVTKIIPTA